MSLDVTIAGTPVVLAPGSLKDLRTDKQLVFDLANDLQPYLNSALALVPVKEPTQVKYTSSAASWSPDGCAVIFGLQGGVACSLEIVNAGNLGKYFDGLESPRLVQVPTPPGRSYVKLTMSFNLSANVSGRYSGGDYGVTAKLSAKDTYAVTFCKAFVPTTMVGTAIAQTFESFVLPFRERLLLDMEDGDYLWYEFDGKVGLAVGAYVGLDEVLYAGNGSADLIKLNGSPLATLGASVRPEVKLAAAMDFKMDYTSRFNAVLSRVGMWGNFHLLKSDSVTDTVTASAGLTINVNSAVTLSQRVAEHMTDLKSSLVQRAGGSGSAGGDAVGKVAGGAASELTKYADELTDKLQCWLNKADGLTCNLQVAIEKDQQKMLLASYTFDLAAPTFGTGWDYAIKGDLYGALNTPAVMLEPGSGLEREYRQKTSFRCNFFNLWHMQSWDEFTSNVSMVYAGNNVFHMLATIGRTIGTHTVGAYRGMDIYFTASADTTAGKPLSNVDVSLNIALNAEGNKQVVDSIAKLLRAFDSTPAMTSVARDLTAFNGNRGKRVVQLLVTIPAKAFSNIQADGQNGLNDQHNWDGFAVAATTLNAWPLMIPMAGLDPTMVTFLQKYSSWEAVNMAETGSSSADRNRFGAFGTFPNDWTTLSSDGPAPRGQIKGSLWAAQRYMNFCAALQQLAAAQTPDAVKPSWEGLLTVVTEAVQQDLTIDFLRPSALATMKLCRGSSYTLTAPIGPAIPVDHFSITITL